MGNVLPLLGVWLLVVLIPGPDFVVIVHYATSRSRRHGAMVAVGSNCAILLWATGSVLGLSMLLARLSWLYEIVRLVGACYLVYLGVRMLWSSRRAARSGAEAASAGVAERASGVQPMPPGPVNMARAWRMGFLTNAGNPKAVVFFGSLMGAFLPPDSSVELRVVVIAALVATCLAWYLVVAGVFGSEPVARLYRRIRRWLDRVMAVVLIVLGGRIAVNG